MTLLPVAVALASGVAALAYQVIWDRMLRLAFGGDALGAVLITSTFLLGLGLGALVFGRRFARPFRVYALVELGLGLYGIASHALLGAISRFVAAQLPPDLGSLDAHRAASGIGITLFLLAPSVLCGGTLPLAFACFAGAEARARHPAVLYGAYTAGSMLGVLLAPLFLLSRLSVRGALVATALCNLACAAALVVGARRVPRATVDGSPTRPTVIDLASAFASGALVLAGELVILRHVGELHPGSPYNFALVLFPYLGALAAGSLLLGRARRDRATVARWFPGAVLALLGSVLMCALLLGRGFLPQGDAQLRFDRASALRWLAYIGCLSVPFGMVVGAIFPRLLAAGEGAALSARTGRLYLMSALGSFVSGVALYAVGWDRLGTRGVVAGMVGLGALIALAARRDRGTAALVAVSGLALLAVPRPSWALLAFGWQGRAPEQTVALEGRSGTAVLRRGSAPGQPSLLFVSGKPFGLLPDEPMWTWTAAFARATARHERVLLLGLGTGTAVRELAADEQVASIDVVDWSAELPLLLRRAEARAAGGVGIDSPKVRLFRADARAAVMLAADGSYDLVYESLTHLGPVGSTHYRSREYYAAVRRLLRAGGTLLSVGVRPGDREVFAAMREAFPWVSWFAPFCVVAGDGPQVLDREKLHRLLEARAARLGEDAPEDLARLGGLRVIADEEWRGATPVSDALLTHEFSVMGARGTRTR